MIVQQGTTRYGLFYTRDAITGDLVEPDAPPTVALEVNGAASAIEVTVTNASTGVYRYQYSTATLAAGDQVQEIASATVGGVAGRSQFEVAIEPRVRAAKADGSEIAGQASVDALAGSEGRSLDDLATPEDVSVSGGFTSDDRTKLEAIKTQADLITTGTPTVKLVSPVGPDGATLDLVRGDDYTEDLVNRPWQFHVLQADVAFTAVDISTVALVVRDKQSGEEVFTSEGVASSSTLDGEATILLTGSIPNSDSSKLRYGRNTGLFDLRLTLSDETRFSPITDGEVNVSGG